MKQSNHSTCGNPRGDNPTLSPTKAFLVCVPKGCQEEDLVGSSHDLRSVRTREITIYAESGVTTNIDTLVSAVLENRYVHKVRFIGVRFCSSFLHRLHEQFSLVWVDHCIVQPIPNELSYINDWDE